MRAYISLAIAVPCAVVMSQSAMGYAIFGQYQVIDLGQANGFINGAPGINNAGAVCFGSGGSGNSGFVWANGVATALPGSDRIIPRRINSSGDVVGLLNPPVPTASFDVWIGGQARRLSSLTGLQGADGRDISDSRTIALRTNAGGFTYDFNSATLRSIGTLVSGGNINEPEAINNFNQVVGYATAASGRTRAFVSQNGVMTELAAAFSPNISTFAYDINNNGVAVGSIDGVQACVFSGGTVTALANVAGSDLVCANAIADSGLIVGFRRRTAGGFRAVVWDQAGAHDLSSLVMNGAGWTFESATGINANGWITGFGSIAGNSTNRSFVLIPVPTPGASLIIMGGMIPVIGRRRS